MPCSTARARTSRRASTAGSRSAMNQLVFADPPTSAARELGADALEQLGYQREAATWRNAYLLGARGTAQAACRRSPRAAANADTLKGVEQRARLRLHGRAAQRGQGRRQAHRASTGLHRSEENYVMTLENSALTHALRPAADKADAGAHADPRRARCHHAQAAHLPGGIRSGRSRSTGDRAKLRRTVRRCSTSSAPGSRSSNRVRWQWNSRLAAPRSTSRDPLRLWRGGSMKPRSYHVRNITHRPGTMAGWETD